MTELINGYLFEQCLVLIPVLNLIGFAIKKIPKIPNWVIPFALGLCGIVAAMLMIGPSIDAVIQGVLVTGAAVLLNQSVKQIGYASEKTE